MGTLETTPQRIILFLAIVLSANAFSKFGRSCQDIGCLPSEECKMAYASCSFSQRDGKECGNYPTCERVRAPSSGSGASLNPAPDNTRYNPSQGNRGYDNRYAGNYPPVDPNTIFGAPNRQPAPQQPNQPWNSQIFPNPTSHRSYPQQPLYPQNPQNPNAPYPYPPQSGSNIFGRNPYQPQQPYAFGLPQPNYPPSYLPTARTPGLFDSILYNKSGGRRRGSSGTQITPSNIIYIISICNVLIASIITFSWDRH